MDKSREFGGTPVVKLGDQFKKVAVSGSTPYLFFETSSPFWRDGNQCSSLDDLLPRGIALPQSIMFIIPAK